MRGLRYVCKKLDEFFFSPAGAEPLAALRISLSALLIAQAFLVARHLHDIYGEFGIIQSKLNNYLMGPLFFVAEAVGPTGLTLIFYLYVASLGMLLLGWHTRVASILAWTTHFVVLMSRGYVSSYGVDTFAHIFLFYLMFFPSNGAYSVDRAEGRNVDILSARNRLGLRVMQLHLAFSYLATGVAKARGAQWWDGEVIWRATMLPEFRQFDVTWLAGAPWLAQILAVSTLIVELGYVVFIWPRATRRCWAYATAALHLGILVFLGLTTFSLVMIALNLSLFGLHGVTGNDRALTRERTRDQLARLFAAIHRPAARA